MERSSALHLRLTREGGAEQTIPIDLSRRREPLSPLIYGQFIEHLGRCIYGGIWAEMLEDRKFHFPITPHYAPYVALTDTAFPVVGRSPWEIVGDPDGLSMDESAPFVGKHSPRLRAGTAIRQHDLGVVANKRYTGYLWARARTPTARVAVRLSLEAAGGAVHEALLDFDAEGFARRDFEFVADATTERGASLEVLVLEGEATLGALSSMPADHVRGLRRDTLELLRELGATSYRWPGGNFVSGYDFRDGLGPRDQRPVRKNPAWSGIEHNDFGTEEFLELCRELGAEPMIAVNAGFGDAHSAAQWVEYTNGSKETIGGSWRARSGHERPHRVRTWCVGNEMYGPWQLGFMAVWQYVLKHRQFAEAMWKVDPELVLVAVGDLFTINACDPEQVKSEKPWSERMLEGAADAMTLLSEHFYEGRTPWTDRGRVPLKEHTEQLRAAIKKRAEGHLQLQAELASLQGRFVPIAMDEWNYWHREYEYGELGCVYDLADALGVAMGLHEYVRQTGVIQMAHYAQSVNVLGAIKTTRIAAELETTGLVLALYRRHFGTVPIDLDLDGIFDLDVVAALDEGGGRLTLGVVNATRASVRFDASPLCPVRGHVVSGPDPGSHNTPGQPRVVDLRPLALGDGSCWQVPPLSCSIVEFEL